MILRETKFQPVFFRSILQRNCKTSQQPPTLLEFKAHLLDDPKVFMNFMTLRRKKRLVFWVIILDLCETSI